MVLRKKQRAFKKSATRIIREGNSGLQTPPTEKLAMVLRKKQRAFKKSATRIIREGNSGLQTPPTEKLWKPKKTDNGTTIQNCLI